ncbi:MAG: hypothetical protein DMD69_16480 [Gemmatimonadetes bacterium]|nr:MAG: hypothetical protein DMD69_16480 [Gemmatimonadota bacterium]
MRPSWSRFAYQPLPEEPAPLVSRVCVAIAWPVKIHVLVSVRRVSAETTWFAPPASVRSLASIPTVDSCPTSRSRRTAPMRACSDATACPGARSSIPMAPTAQGPALPVSRSPAPGSAIRREKNRFTGVWK